MRCVYVSDAADEAFTEGRYNQNRSSRRKRFATERSMQRALPSPAVERGPGGEERGSLFLAVDDVRASSRPRSILMRPL